MTVRDLIILGCSSQQPTRYRNHGGYLLRWNEEGFLFDPGEGIQRQFIFAEVAPPAVTRIFISHFHGDHCLGVGSMLMRLNLDKVKHPIHCYYPASGKKYFHRLRYGTIYHENINVIEHPIKKEGVVHDDGKFCIEAAFLDHGGVDNIGWRISEADRRKFYPDKLKALGIHGPMVRQLKEKETLIIDGKEVHIDDVSWIREGDVIAVIADTRPCDNAVKLSENARLLLCESTYLEDKKEMAHKHCHLTAKQAANIAKKANVKQLVLTHFSARYQSLQEFKKEGKSVFPNTHIAEDLKVFPLPR